MKMNVHMLTWTGEDFIFEEKKEPDSPNSPNYC